MKDVSSLIFLLCLNCATIGIGLGSIFNGNIFGAIGICWGFGTIIFLILTSRNLITNLTQIPDEIQNNTSEK